MNSGARLWLIEADADLRELLLKRFTECGWNAKGWQGPQSLLQALGDEMPHALVLDRQQSGPEGLTSLRELRRLGYRFPVLILSTLAEPEQRVEALELGANDYLAKPFLWRELQLRLELLLEQQRELGPLRLSGPEVFRIDALRFEPDQLRLQGPEGQEASLSRADASLLNFLALAPGITFERQQLLQATGSLVESRSSRSLDMRISKLRRQFDHCQSGAGRLIEAVRGRGYRLQANVERSNA